MTPAAAAPPASGASVTLVTQTRVKPEFDGEFSHWQQRMNDVVERFPGFVDRQVMPPSPPVQPDWVIVQRFTGVAAAQAWLSSRERQGLVAEAQPWLLGHDDVHIIEDSTPPSQSSSVSFVVSTRIRPGQEEAFRAWTQRINTAQTRYPGFQGFKLNPPIPGVQDDWVTILQFDTEAHMNVWLASPERQTLLKEAAAFTTESHTRTVRSGFEQWFRLDGAMSRAPAWKMNMLTLSALYPVVFLFGFFVQTPILMKAWGWPFWLALFAGNVAGVTILNWLVPWVGKRFAWWLQPAGMETRKLTIIGIIAIVALYGLFLLAFSRFP